MAFADLSSELTGTLPGLSSFLADSYINRAWKRVREARLWSFLLRDDSVICPAQITAGTAAITQYNNQVTMNAAASAALIAVDSVQIPLTFLQIRFGTVPGQIYNITVANVATPSAVVLTLDRTVQEATNAASPYMVYRPYVAAPESDFLQWLSMTDVANGITVSLNYQSWQFDMTDPSRNVLGLATKLGRYRSSTDPDPVPIYELYPGPTTGQSFYVRYRSKGADFSAPSHSQPSVIPDALLVQGALAFDAYPWAKANEGHFPALKGTWDELIVEAAKKYQEQLALAIQQDVPSQGLEPVY